MDLFTRKVFLMIHNRSSLVKLLLWKDTTNKLLARVILLDVLVMSLIG